jgi:hypothetical protein
MAGQPAEALAKAGCRKNDDFCFGRKLFWINAF